jgi:DnaJ domain
MGPSHPALATEVAELFGASIEAKRGHHSLWRPAVSQNRQRSKGPKGEGHERHRNKTRPAWWEVLGVPEEASLEEAKVAYRTRVKQYHPDRVAGLGAEFSELAERKTRQLNDAIEEAKRDCGSNRTPEHVEVPAVPPPRQARAVPLKTLWGALALVGGIGGFVAFAGLGQAPAPSAKIEPDKKNPSLLTVSYSPPTEPVRLTPPAPPPMPTYSNEQAASDFIRNVVADWSSPNDRAVRAMEAIYEGSVTYFGKVTPRQAVLDDKRRFIQRWPRRSYSIQPQTLVTRCDGRFSSCIISGMMDWTATNSTRRSTGVASFQYVVRRGQNGSMLIAEETSKVVTGPIITSALALSPHP